MPRMRIAAAMVVGLGLVFGFQVGAVAADDEAVPSRLTIQGQPLAQIVRTEPMAPFLAFEPGLVCVDAQASCAEQSVSGGKQGTSRRKTILVSSAMGAGAGLLYGFKMCENQICPYFGWGGLVGFGMGAGVGALLALVAGS